MRLPSKKSKFDLAELPEVFVSSKDIASAVSKATQAGRLRKIGSRLYTKLQREAPEAIVKRNWHFLLKEYFPDALISDRTALENRPAPDGSVFLISAGTRSIQLPGITFRPRAGHPPLENDLPFLGVHLSSAPRAWIENMRPSRKRGAQAARTLWKNELEERLDKLLRQGGEQALNRLRDDARKVSRQLRLPKEFKALDQLIGAFLGTRAAKLRTTVGQARKKGTPFDPDRVELFQTLFQELNARAPITRSAAAMTEPAKINIAFFESYFSNFIEGTEFTVDEAQEIVFEHAIPSHRPADAHDVLETFQVVSDEREMAALPRDFATFITRLQARHAKIMGLRPDQSPGQFKTRENRAGNTLFVAPDLVLGTLQQGYEIYRAIEPPLHRAIFMMFFVSEIHPFADGNGRVARIMMNAELVAAKEQKIIIPTVYRNNYLSALKTLSQSARPLPIIQVLDFAQRYTASIPWENLATARSTLQATHAFLDSTQAEDRGLRLRLPGTE